MLKEKLQSDLREAMKAGDEVWRDTLRMVLSAIKNKEIEKLGPLNDEQLLDVLISEVKKRKESIELFKAGNRADLVKKETGELEILQKYLPAQLSKDELATIVDEAIKSTGSTSIKDMGKVIAAVMAHAKGKAEGATVSALVKKKLS